jgi:hypothetical protein
MVELLDILGTQVHATVQMLFLNNDATIQNDNVPIHRARSVQSWFEEYEFALHLPQPAQWPHLNIIRSLWSVSESRMRSRFPHLSSNYKMFYMKSGAIFH